MGKKEESDAKKLAGDMEIRHKKFNLILPIGIIIIIILGAIYFINRFDNGDNLIGQQKLGRNEIKRDNCYLESLLIKDENSNVFKCNTVDDCINSLKEFQKTTGTPLPPQSVLDIIECLPDETEVTE